jgi:glutamate-ammonia-ligase adenylyltransferase
MFRQKNLSNDFISKIIEKAAGKVPHKMLEDFLSSIEKEIINHYFTKTSESNLLRIIQNQFDVAFFINECINYPHQIEILITITNNSNYLTDILVRNPEYFHWIINPSVLQQTLDDKYFSSALEKSVSSFKSFDSKVNAIRNFKRKEILRIGLKDIYLKEELKGTTLNLSNLAVSISSVLFDLCYQEILTKYKINKPANRFVIFSLGKLGGNELNYSSDIDLIAFYDKNAFINKKIYYNQILTETILLFIETASKKTGYGFLYRVDFRLRPDGRNAPLCSSFTEYLRYYEMRGEDWERQMLIKANYLCGSRSLYDKFFNYATVFIYPGSFTISPIEQIRKLKVSIEKRIKSDENIKLVAGGLRNIEFSIQALQLLNGGKDLTIRIGNSLSAIEVLKAKNILTNEEAIVFTEAYIFYRRGEHYLQLMNDQQTHTIPAIGEIAEKLGSFLGFKQLTDFKKELNSFKEKVQKVYNAIVDTEIFIEIENDFDKLKFADSKRAKNNFDFLRTGKNLFEKKQFDVRTNSAFEKIEEHLIFFLSSSINPDLVLENFSRVIKTANFPQIWYEEFTDQKYFNLFLNLCEHSQKSIDLFAEDKYLRDEFLSRDCLIVYDKLLNIKLDLKTFNFNSSVQLTANILSSKIFSNLYSKYLDDNISAFVLDYSKDKEWDNNYFVAAMGSFGTSELSFSSDIDLIFIVRDILKFPGIQKDFQNLLTKLKLNFPGLEIDCRLRPEGKSSQLVWDISDYKKYFTNRARIWELQSFTKCRMIIGDNKLFYGFINNYIEVISQKNSAQIKNEMQDMRKKLYPISNDSFNLKKSPGSLTDIDFIKSFFLLSFPDLLKQRFENPHLNSFELIKQISQDKINFVMLENSFLFLKQIELTNQNIFNTKLSKIPTEEIKLKTLANQCGFKDSKSFTSKLNETINYIHKDFQNTFN